MKKITILLVMVLIFSLVLGNRVTLGITNLNKPTNVYAYAVGTTVFLKWDYSYSGSATLKFLIYEYNYNTNAWDYKGSVNYPTKSKAFTGQSYGKHRYRIRAKEDWPFPFTDKYSDYTTPVYAYVLHKPTNLKAKLDPDNLISIPPHTGSINVTLSWDPVDSNANYIKIMRKKGGSNVWINQATVDKSKTSWIDTTVSPNTEYDYKIYVTKEDETNKMNDFSSFSSTVSVLTFPKAPTNFDAYALKKSVYLSWSHDGNCDGFKIYKKTGIFLWSWTLIKTLSNSKFSYAFNVTNYGAYKYKVTAYNSSGDSPAAPQGVVYVLEPPSGLVATLLSSTSIKLTWNPVDSNASNVIILRSTNGVSFGVYKTLSATTTSYIDTNLTPETTYWYALWAKRDKNTSDWSNIVSATTPAAGTPPSSPTDLTATPVSCNQIDLSWNDNSSDEDNFIVERKEEGGTFSVITTLPANTTNYSDTTVNPQTKYFYRVKAKNSWGDSGYSNVASATTPACGVPPSAPTDLTATVQDSTTIKITWTDNSDNEDGFKIERKEEGGTFSEIETVPPNTTSYTDTNLTPETTYTYRVRAYNSFGNSSYSNEVSATTPPVITIPNAPTNLKVAEITSDSVTLTWDDNSDNEDGFKLYRREKEEVDFSLLTNLPADTTTYTDSSVEQEKTYYYKVLAYNSFGESDFSNVVAAVIPPSKPETPTNFKITETVGRSVSFSFNFSGECDGFTIFEVNGTKHRVLELNKNDRDATLDDVDYGIHKFVIASYKLSGGERIYSDDSDEVQTYIIRPPTNLYGEVVDKNTIRLKWINNDENIDKIRIYRRTETTSFHMIAEIPLTNTYIDSSCSPDTTYFYYVVGVKDTPKSISGKSNEVKIKTPPSIEQIVIRLYIGKTYYFVNDERKTMDVAPIIREGRTLLPIRYVAEALGADVGWDGEEEKVTITFKGTVIELWIGKNSARVNGEYKLIDPTNPNVKPIIIPPGRTMLPVRFVAENLGCRVDWDENLREVKITYPKD